MKISFLGYVRQFVLSVIIGADLLKVRYSRLLLL